MEAGLSTVTLGELRQLGTAASISCDSQGPTDERVVSNTEASRDRLDVTARLSAATTAKLAGLDHEPVMLGGYEIERLIGIGGMGRVFAARSRADERRVALKILHRSSARALLSLKREFRVLAEVEHPNLVDLDTLVVDADGEAFFTMELVRGQSLVEYVRGRLHRLQAPNSARVRRVLVQLLSALEHLHASGYVHRDLKPSNVMVNDEGRVVVLDFGLVDELDDARELGDDRMLGTPAYMAPEQASLDSAGPAADLYAVGVMLFECLTGTRPFVGSVREVLTAKREQPAPNLTELVPDVDRKLASLCVELLERAPERRPSATAVLERLRRAPDTVRPPTPPFVGRIAERAALDRSLADLRAGRRPILTLVHGPSGYGKSSLLSRWRASLRGDELVLRGCCFERESVPYKGLDAIIDALSTNLRRLPDATREALRPPDLAEAVRLFPVLEAVWPMPDPPIVGLEPAERRERALASLRELLSRLARTRTVVLMLDNFHWADADSAALLNQLLDNADAPPIVAVIAYREPPDPGPAVVRLGAAADSRWLERRRLELAPLTDAEARELVAALHSEHVAPAIVDALVRDSAGNPGEMCERARGIDAEGSTDLDRVVVQRLLALSPERRRILILVALAGGPIERAALDAAGCTVADFDALLDEELVRASELDGAQVEVGHERIARLTIAQVPAEELAGHNLALARALARVGARPELLAEHFERGEELGQAFVHAQRAAQQAMEAFAFHRAATWLERCLAWLPPDETPGIRRALQLQLVRAHANSGRLVDAAKLLLELADEASDADARGLRIQAVLHLLSAGHVAEGTREAEALLTAVGLEMPRGRALMILNVLRFRRRLAADLARLDRRLPANDDPRLRERARVCEAMCTGFTSHDGLVMFQFLTLWRRLAIEIGDHRSCARALAVDSTFCASNGWLDLAATLMKRATELAGDDPDTRVRITALQTHVGFNSAEFRHSLAAYDAAVPALESHPDGLWDRHLAQYAAMAILNYAGHHRRLIALGRRNVELAVELGHVKHARDSAGLLAWSLACVGQLDEADQLIAKIEQVEQGFVDGSYAFADMFRDFARIHALSRRGELDQALDAALALPGKMKPDGLWQVISFRLTALSLIAAAMLRVWLRAPTRRGRWRLQRLARQLSGVSIYQRGNGALVEATLAEQAGEREAALALLGEAEDCFDQAGAEANLACTRLRRASLLDGKDSRQLRAEAQAYFEREAIQNPEELVRILAPGPAYR
jgi:serine/threonine protein kinase